LPSDSFVDEAVEIQLPDGKYWRPSDGTPPSGAAMSLRDGLTCSKNTITAQLMQTVGPAKVATLAQAMGVRQSKLEGICSPPPSRTPDVPD
jgi:penicillin-binding protein 1A